MLKGPFIGSLLKPLPLMVREHLRLKGVKL